MYLSTTKDKIIYHSIVLFGTYGYTNVSMRQIATDVGIQSSSIYNHFAGKEEILDAVIETYWRIFSSYHPSFSELRRLAPTHTGREIVQKLHFIYQPEDVMIMLYLLRVQFSEQFRNDKIRHLVFDTFLDGRMKDIADLLQYLMELGKIPAADANALAQVWTSTMSMAAMRAAHRVDFPQDDLDEFANCTDFLLDMICGKQEADG